MNVTKLPSGSYRARLTHKKVNYSFVFDHKPTQTEVIDKIVELLSNAPESACMTFREASEQYIDMKRYVLSPSSIREYVRKVERLPESFTSLPVDDITHIILQKQINSLSKTHSPKSVKDYHSFIVSVIKTQLPDFQSNCTLPQMKHTEPYIPTTEEVKIIIDYTKEYYPQYYVAIMLGCWGLRRSEIIAVKDTDIDKDGYLHIQRAIVQNDIDEWVSKTTKTQKSDRYIYIPEDVAEIIKRKGYAYKGSPQNISNYLRRTQDKLKMPHFSIHKLRHYFCTYLSEKGIPDAEIMEMGGWSTDYVMKSRYRHAMSTKTKEGKKNLNQLLEESIQ